MTRHLLSVGLAAAMTVTAACSNSSGFEEVRGYGTNPTLPEPDTSLIPTINVVKAVGWAEGEQPTAATGTMVTAFAKGRDADADGLAELRLPFLTGLNAPFGMALVANDPALTLRAKIPEGADR